MSTKQETGDAAQQISQQNGCDADFKSGWEAAMESIWERLPMPAYGSDPMTPREVEKLLAYVKSNLPNSQDQAREAKGGAE